jgi:hypothetical protein
MVICLSKFPCDILELEKDQKEANKRETTNRAARFNFKSNPRGSKMHF